MPTRVPLRRRKTECLSKCFFFTQASCFRVLCLLPSNLLHLHDKMSIFSLRTVIIFFRFDRKQGIYSNRRSICAAEPPLCTYLTRVVLPGQVTCVMAADAAQCTISDVEHGWHQQAGIWKNDLTLDPLCPTRVFASQRLMGNKCQKCISVPRMSLVSHSSTIAPVKFQEHLEMCLFRHGPYYSRPIVCNSISA